MKTKLAGRVLMSIQTPQVGFFSRKWWVDPGLPGTRVPGEPETGPCPAGSGCGTQSVTQKNQAVLFKAAQFLATKIQPLGQLRPQTQRTGTTNRFALLNKNGMLCGQVGIFQVGITKNKKCFFCGQEEKWVVLRSVFFGGLWPFRTKNGTFRGKKVFGLGRRTRNGLGFQGRENDPICGSACVSATGHCEATAIRGS